MATFLEIAIQVLKAVIPALGSLIGGPFGAIAGWLLGIATEYLAKALERYAKFAKIDGVVKDQLKKMGTATEIYKAVQANPFASDEERAKAHEAFRIAAINLSRIRL